MKRKISIFAAIVLSMQLVASAIVPITAAEPVSPVKLPLISANNEAVEGNLIEGGDLDKENSFIDFKTTSTALPYKWIEAENGGGYIETGKLPNEYTGLNYTPKMSVPAGTYKVTFYVRTVYEGHATQMSLMLVDKAGGNGYLKVAGEKKIFLNANVNDEWAKIEYIVRLDADLSYLYFRGIPYPIYNVPFCIDDISIVKVEDKELKSNQTYPKGPSVSAANILKSCESLDYIDENAGKKKWNPEEESKYEVQGIMLNMDNTAHGLGYISTEAEIAEYGKIFKGTQVTDIVMNIAESACVYPTDVFLGWYGDKYGQRQEYDENTGKMVEINHDGFAGKWYKHYKEQNLDYLKTLSETLPKEGINMWLSIRMNDAHDRSLGTSVLFTDYYHNNPQNRRVLYDSKVVGTSYARILNYAIPDVRNRYLALVNESLDRYDVYGYQYEFQRNLWMLPVGMEYSGIDIFNQFMRDTDAILSIYEEKYGHEIKMAVQVAPDLQTNYDFGLDVMTWVSEGLVDMVSPMGRWATTHNELPVALWDTLLEPYGVELIPCIEHGISSAPTLGNGSHIFPDIEMYAGTSALYLSQGADKLQFYNILVPLGYKFKENDKLAHYDPDTPIPESTTESSAGWWELLTTCGSYDKLMTMNRKVIPTYNDMAILWKNANSTMQLPKLISTGQTGVLRIGMGDVPDGATVTFKFAAKDADASKAPKVYINSELCEFIGIEPSPDYKFTANSLYCYMVPTGAHDDMFVVAEITPPQKVALTIDYAEIFIEPAK